jgi:hypothetical protein
LVLRESWGVWDIIIRNKSFINDKNKGYNFITFSMVLIGLIVIFSYGLGNVSAAPVNTLSVNGVSDSIGQVSENPIKQTTNQIEISNKPAVNTTDPVNKSVNIPTNKSIIITFNKPVKFGSKWIELKNSSGAKIPFTATINGNSLIISHNALAYGVIYTVILHTNSITDLTGNGTVLYTTKFTTITRPVVKSISPGTDGYNVPTNKIIQINFNRNIKLSKNSWIELVNNKGTHVLFNTTVTGTVLKISPKSLLAHGTKYTVILHTNSITDLLGNGITPWSTKFTTIVNTKTMTSNGVSFNYSSIWSTSLQTQGSTKIIFIYSQNYKTGFVPQAIISVMPNPYGMTDEEAMDSIKSATFPSGVKILSKKLITLNGIKAYDTVYTVNNLNMYPEIVENEEFDFVKNNKTYVLDCIVGVKNFKTEKSNFDIIINSLKIQ